MKALFRKPKSQIQAIAVRPGDLVVLKLDHLAHGCDLRSYHQTLAKVFPRNATAILDPGASLSVLRGA